MVINDEGVAEPTRQIIHHHAVLRRGLEQQAGALCEAAESGFPFEAQLNSLRKYLDGEILPHAQAEERTLYAAAASKARGSELVDTLIAEHRELAGQIVRLQPGVDGSEAAAVSEGIATLFASHVAKENDLLLPALESSGADMTALLADMHQLQAGAHAA